MGRPRLGATEGRKGHPRKTGKSANTGTMPTSSAVMGTATTPFNAPETIVVAAPGDTASRTDGEHEVINETQELWPEPRRMQEPSVGRHLAVDVDASTRPDQYDVMLEEAGWEQRPMAASTSWASGIGAGFSTAASHPNP